MPKSLERKFYAIYHNMVAYANKHGIGIHKDWITQKGEAVGEGFYRFKEKFYKDWLTMQKANPKKNIAVVRKNLKSPFSLRNMHIGEAKRNPSTRDRCDIIAKKEGKKDRVFKTPQSAEASLKLSKNAVNRSLNGGYSMKGWTFHYSDETKEKEAIEKRKLNQAKDKERMRQRYLAKKQ